MGLFKSVHGTPLSRPLDARETDSSQALVRVVEREFA